VQNRTERVTYTISGLDGHVTSKAGFADQNVLDRFVGVGIAAHEGHLFGRINLIDRHQPDRHYGKRHHLWTRRKPKELLGAPRPVAAPRFSGALVAIILLVAFVIPLFGLSLLTILALERILLRRMPTISRWLGLRGRAVHGEHRPVGQIPEVTAVVQAC